MQRRRFLAGTAAVGMAVTAGCLGDFAPDNDGVILTHVELGNATGEPQVFDVLVVHDETIIHWAGHEVGIGDEAGEAGGTVIAIDGPEDYGHVEVAVRVDEMWQRTDFVTDEYAGERVIAVVTYGLGDDEMLRISRRVADRPPAT